VYPAHAQFFRQFAGHVVFPGPLSALVSFLQSNHMGPREQLVIGESPRGGFDMSGNQVTSPAWPREPGLAK
jgi:hypothetical protein